jgi:hypothetical protein
VLTAWENCKTSTKDLRAMQKIAACATKKVSEKNTARVQVNRNQE